MDSTRGEKLMALSSFLQKQHVCKEEKLECAADGMYRVLKK